MTQRVTDEQALNVAKGTYPVHFESRCSARDLAADLLDARAELAEIAASFAATVAGECPPDEQHCACVPALRAEIAALRVKLEALRLVDTLARNSTDMTKIREAEKAAYACGAIGEEP